MKTRVITYLSIFLCFGHVFSQELRPMPLDLEALTNQEIDFNFEEDMQSNVLSFLQVYDAYTMQILKFEQDDFSVGMYSRVEEELPFEEGNYDYDAFYYLDLGFSYAINKFSFSMSLENFLNLKNSNFGIDPMLESSKGIIDAFYFSHEADTILKLMITYSF
ncbi:hypothetical protein [Psychroserpens ponticola]|uniref:TonB-dependent receptor n=1 Tax=Psychroserpens ponticola TaxID=2932268 RepID=A0ABY7RUC3_9FLAO|nr:hypothetical protein [Psychroserpens ponticola]WCO00715.1 hypothetical protein MUN68_011625 [Psychroserpens ponticola]